MTSHEGEATAIEQVMAVLAEHGLEGLTKAGEPLMNEAMRVERAALPCARPHERTADRARHSNGFKPKEVATRLGRLDLSVPQA